MSIAMKYPKLIRALVCTSGLIMSMAVRAESMNDNGVF
jgi:hypothetical protein